MREKSIQITERLFIEIVQYFLLDNRNQEQEQSIKQSLSHKLDAIVLHDLYTKYKTDPSPELQEKARNEYLDKAGISQSFRW